MNQNEANRILSSPLSEQCPSIFVTSDDSVFIRESEAVRHSATLKDESYQEWFAESIVSQEEKILLFIKEWFDKNPATVVVDDEDYEPINRNIITKCIEGEFDSVGFTDFTVEFESATVVMMDKDGLIIVSYPTNYEDEIAYEDAELEDLLIVKQLLENIS